MIEDLEELWKKTKGDRRVRIAVLDGPVDVAHPSLVHARLEVVQSLIPNLPTLGVASRHGTHVASVILGQHDGPVRGIAPECSGLIIPIYTDSSLNTTRPCSQIDLARAINLAIQSGATIINVSGGQFMPSGEAYPLLADVVRSCVREGILIVAAVGNDGCDCLHIPGALPSVLAVGASDLNGIPLSFSNWGNKYRYQGLIAPGEQILGALPGGGTATYNGTSFATAIVSGVVALLVSLQLKQGRKADPLAIRDILLETALGCDAGEEEESCHRLLRGQLNVRDAAKYIIQGVSPMADNIHPQSGPEAIVDGEATIPDSFVREESYGDADSASLAAAIQPASFGSGSPSDADLRKQAEREPIVGLAEAPTIAQSDFQAPTPQERITPLSVDAVAPSGSCSCHGSGGSAAIQLVYALGKIAYDFGSDARRDSIAVSMSGNPSNPEALLDYLDKNPWDSASINWTLAVKSVPIYAIKPNGPFASEIYSRIRRFIREQISEGVEFVSIPAYGTGQTLTLSSGQPVPVIQPELRGMASWTTKALVDSVVGPKPADSAPEKEQSAHDTKIEGLTNFLSRVYFELENLGMTSQERALNYAATNAFLVARAFELAIKDTMELDTIEVERSSICRPDSDCWDVKLFFFFPLKEVQVVRRVYRFTVDVSDVVPVLIGDMKVWSVR
jgi:cyanobactin maturation PatA/PatG family protease